MRIAERKARLTWRTLLLGSKLSNTDALRYRRGSLCVVRALTATPTTSLSRCLAPARPNVAPARRSISIPAAVQGGRAAGRRRSQPGLSLRRRNIRHRDGGRDPRASREPPLLSARALARFAARRHGDRVDTESDVASVARSLRVRRAMGPLLQSSVASSRSVLFARARPHHPDAAVARRAPRARRRLSRRVSPLLVVVPPRRPLAHQPLALGRHVRPHFDYATA